MIASAFRSSDSASRTSCSASEGASGAVSSSSNRTICWMPATTRCFSLVGRPGIVNTARSAMPEAARSSRTRVPARSFPTTPASETRAQARERCCHVARASQDVPLALLPEHGHGRLRRDALDRPERVPVEHDVADDERPRTAEMCNRLLKRHACATMEPTREPGRSSVAESREVPFLR